MRPGGQYQKGANRERQFIVKMKTAGALWAARTAGSHTPADVMCVFPNKVCLYQIKAGKAKMTEEELAEICDLAESMPHVEVYSVEWPNRQEPMVVRVNPG